MMFKKRYFIILIIIFFLVGGEFNQRSIFPYGIGLRKLLPDFLKISTGFCEQEYYINKIFDFFSNEKINNIFIGDSLVVNAHSTKLFKLNYERIAVRGVTIDCSKIMLGYIQKIQPKNLIIYLGGNDADGQSNYDSNKASEIYSKFVNDLKKIDSISKIYLIGINKGLPSNRDINYVLNLNKNIKNLRDDTKVLYIESFEELNFKQQTLFVDDVTAATTPNQLSYDGEHLRYLGYKKWFNYLNSYIPNFMKE